MINGKLRLQHLYEAYAYQKTPHFHDMNEMLFTMNDDSVMYINHDEFPIRAGTLIFIAQGSLHAKINSDFRQINSYVVHYPATLLDELSTSTADLHNRFADLNTCIQFDTSDIGRVLGLFQQMDFDSKADASSLHNLLCFAGILLTASSRLDNGQTVEPTHFIHEDKWLAPILNYIDSHLTEPLTLDELAARFFISKGSLCHAFKRKTNFTIVTYINMQRIRYACILLRQGVSVQETCYRSGFTTVEHFIRTFSAYVDTTPGKYAKSFQQGQNVPVPFAVFMPEVDERQY